jgi:hypothetical protein
MKPEHLRLRLSAGALASDGEAAETPLTIAELGVALLAVNRAVSGAAWSAALRQRPELESLAPRSTGEPTLVDVEIQRVSNGSIELDVGLVVNTFLAAQVFQGSLVKAMLENAAYDLTKHLVKELKTGAKRLLRGPSGSPWPPQDRAISVRVLAEEGGPLIDLDVQIGGTRIEVRANDPTRSRRRR